MLCARMYFRNFGPTFAFLINSRRVVIWVSSIVLPFPSLRRVECKLGLFRLPSFVDCDDAVDFFDIGAGIKRHPFNQSQNRSSAVQWWRGEMLNLLHQNSSFSGLSSALRSPFARRCHARPS